MSRNKQTNRGLAHAKFSFERLEPRLVLDGDFTFAPHQFVPDTPQEQAIADKAGTDLAWLYTDYQDWQASGESEPFTTFSPAMGQLGFAVQDANVAIEAYANQDAASIEGALRSTRLPRAGFLRTWRRWLVPNRINR